MSRLELLASLQAQMDAIAKGATDENVAPSRMAFDNAYHDAPSFGRETQGMPSSSAFRKIIDLVNASDKSEAAIRDRLARYDFSAAEIDDAVERAKECGFIDDLRYADVLIRSRVAQGKGSSGIERELKSHGIDVIDVPGWPDEFGIDYSMELERAIDFLKRKPPQSKNAREAAFRKLVNKGYSTSISSSAAREWFERSRCFYGDDDTA